MNDNDDSRMKSNFLGDHERDGISGHISTRGKVTLSPSEKFRDQLTRPSATSVTIFIFVITLVVGFCQCGVSQMYSSDIPHIDWRRGRGSENISPIGDIGAIEAVIDLRGFVPLSLYSNNPNPVTNGRIWFKYPIKEGVALFYYGTNYAKVEATLDKVKWLSEDHLGGDNSIWAKFAYQLSNNYGNQLYEVSGGGSGLDGAEPIAVIITERSAIVILNFRFSGFGPRNAEGHGQCLCAYEFSKTFKEFRTYYSLLNTFLFSKSTKAVLNDSIPIIRVALAAYFGQ